ncbi:DUF192 domain-containing protein [uncultured Nonlabens sp.]|uniref:DUF192 domain-containing protein n=1 Tax=uncultured Nonlabens sp. TaxID=859306 RepID=UPI00261D7A52|nr:DUF192 domain-containing protein [uncultured Nonlabens sp.]
MRKLFLSTTILSCLLYSCKPDQETAIKARDWSFKDEAGGVLINKENDTLKELKLELADTDYTIQLGMMYREQLTEDQGMLFVFNDSRPRFFYMKNTDVPLDIIYITTDNHIDSYYTDAVPKDETLLKSKGDAQYVLQVKAGMVEKWKLKEGDLFKWQ